MAGDWLKVVATQVTQPRHDGRYVCTKDEPWSAEKAPRAVHPDAECVGECHEGCCDRYRCPNCGARWTNENDA